MALLWKQYFPAIKSIIPTLSSLSHKGQGGRVGIIGGSFEYTGAPCFAASSALKVGADLVYIICAEEAGIPIKCFSPDFIVYPYLKCGINMPSSESTIASHINDTIFSRLYSLVIGPGLGRDPLVAATTLSLISMAKDRKIPLVIDGDGLFHLCQGDNLSLITGYQRTILTPNPFEFTRLWEASQIEREEGLKMPPSSRPVFEKYIDEKCSKEEYTTVFEAEMDALKRLAARLGNVTILKKGYVDLISNGREVAICDEIGGGKRCGGQGDWLAGSIGTLMAWMNKGAESEPNWMLAAVAGSALIRKTSEMTFAKHRRSMTSSEMGEFVAEAFRTQFQVDDDTEFEEEKRRKCGHSDGIKLPMSSSSSASSASSPS